MDPWAQPLTTDEEEDTWIYSVIIIIYEMNGRTCHFTIVKSPAKAHVYFAAVYCAPLLQLGRELGNKYNNNLIIFMSPDYNWEANKLAPRQWKIFSGKRKSCKRDLPLCFWTISFFLSLYRIGRDNRRPLSTLSLWPTLWHLPQLFFHFFGDVLAGGPLATVYAYSCLMQPLYYQCICQGNRGKDGREE